MFTPEIAKKCSFVLNTKVEEEFILMLNDVINQRVASTKADSSDLALRIAAVEIGLLNKLKNYRQLLGTAVKNHGNNGQ